MNFDIYCRVPNGSEPNALRRYSELLDEAVEAELLGFKTMWLADACLNSDGVSTAPKMLLTAIASRTRRLRLGLVAGLQSLRSPQQLAEDLAVLETVSAGRAALTCAIPKTVAPQSARSSGVPQLGDSLKVLREPWATSEPAVEAAVGRGARCSSSRTLCRFRIAPSTMDDFMLAGESGCPIFVGGCDVCISDLCEKLKVYRRATTDAGRPLPDDWLAATFRVSLGTQLDEQLIGAKSIRDTQSHNKTNGFHSDTPCMTVKEGASIRGGPDDCVERIWQLKVSLGFSRFVCFFENAGTGLQEQMLESMTTFAEGVMPAFGEVP